MLSLLSQIPRYTLLYGPLRTEDPQDHLVPLGNRTSRYRLPPRHARAPRRTLTRLRQGFLGTWNAARETPISKSLRNPVSKCTDVALAGLLRRRPTLTIRSKDGRCDAYGLEQAISGTRRPRHVFSIDGTRPAMVRVAYRNGRGESCAKQKQQSTGKCFR